MIRLGKVELRRLYARRLTLLGVLAATIITGLLLFAVYQDSKPLSDADPAAAGPVRGSAAAVGGAAGVPPGEQGSIKQLLRARRGANQRQRDPRRRLPRRGPDLGELGQAAGGVAELRPTTCSGIRRAAGGSRRS